jgi:3-hydroxyacyl-[acyl-carrier-protein] dehydratase
MPPLFDGPLEIEAGVRATAVRAVPQTLAIFDTHFPRFPVLPGVLLLDDAAAVAALALGDEDGGGAWILAGAARVRYRHFVRPGDRAVITAEVVAVDGGTATCRARVQVDGRTVTTIRTLRLTRAATEPPVTAGATTEEAR